MGEMTQAQAKREFTIYPESTRASMKFWIGDNDVRIEIYNSWGTLDSYICMTKQELLSSLKIISQEVSK